eukprot:sb/3473235/
MVTNTIGSEVFTSVLEVTELDASEGIIQFDPSFTYGDTSIGNTTLDVGTGPSVYGFGMTEGGLEETSKTGAIVPIANQGICFHIFTLCPSLSLSLSLCLAPSLFLGYAIGLALVIRDTYESGRHNDGSRRHTDVSRRHNDDRVSHFRQIYIRYS